MSKFRIFNLTLITLTILFCTNLSASELIPQTNWSLWYVDSEEHLGEDGAAVNAFDGDINTFWHTQWVGGSPPTPHEIQIDLDGIYDIDGFYYLPRQDGGVNGRIGQYEFYVSM
ncbi:MAG: discoidin domain-containing protein, partial [Candidatus Brocadiaceae bacterium]|nr:discoidin domain-containing protein [Candidatus Brocadiaceae bacterium]